MFELVVRFMVETLVFNSSTLNRASSRGSHYLRRYFTGGFYLDDDYSILLDSFMADSSAKKLKTTPARATRTRSSFQLEVEDGMDDRLEEMKSRIQRVKSVLRITSRTPMGNFLMMERLISLFEESERGRMVDTASHSSLFLSEPSPQPSPSFSEKCDAQTQTDLCDRYILAHGENTTGNFDIHTPSKRVEDYFISSIEAVRSLIATMTHYGGRCPLCSYHLEMSSFEVVRHGHVVRISVGCVAGHSLRWNSSSSIGGKYTANMRILHGFISSGLTETQYIGSCRAARIGNVDERYIATVYSSLGYKNAVKTWYEMKLQEAQMEAQQDPQYFLHGDIIITDARHDSSRAAQHTTVSALSYGTKVIYCLNWDKEDMPSAASREVPMTKVVVESLTASGHHVGEVAHDYVPALKLWLGSKGIKNSYDSWHGGKGVKKAIKKVASGLVRDSEKFWYAELSDKVKCTKTHIYYAMKNCNGDAAELQRYIVNIVDHYQGDHSNCYHESRCHQQGYQCSKKPLVSAQAIAAYHKAIVGTTIYKNAGDYALCRDTYWIESLHMVMLIYAQKRIHFSRKDTYEMRMQLAVLDWNENVLREATSEQYYQTSRQPDRTSPHRVLSDKTQEFKDDIWTTFYNSL